jgi:hypothetical protein
MWSEQAIINSAWKYADKKMEQDEFYEEELDVVDVVEAFIAGCKYILNNTQKDDNI